MLTGYLKGDQNMGKPGKGKREGVGPPPTEERAFAGLRLGECSIFQGLGKQKDSRAGDTPRAGTQQRF